MCRRERSRRTEMAKDGNCLHGRCVLNVGIPSSLKTNSFCSSRLMISTSMHYEKCRRIEDIGQQQIVNLIEQSASSAELDIEM
jgi:hypothetical protein